MSITLQNPLLPAILQNDFQQIRLEIGRNNAGETVVRALRCYRSLELSLTYRIVGAYIGMFASGNGTMYDEYAAFDWFSYEGQDE